MLCSVCLVYSLEGLCRHAWWFPEFAYHVLRSDAADLDFFYSVSMRLKSCLFLDGF